VLHVLSVLMTFSYQKVLHVVSVLLTFGYQKVLHVVSVLLTFGYQKVLRVLSVLMINNKISIFIHRKNYVSLNNTSRFQKSYLIVTRQKHAVLHRASTEI
jgi:hypothetical protein